MGGRMSGESPREEKVDDAAACNSAVTADKVRSAGDAVAPMLKTQRSRQQLMACCPLGQHESCDVSDCTIAVVWQSADIKGEVAAKAATEPCRPRANIKIRAMISRFMPGSLTAMSPRRKLTVRSPAQTRGVCRDLHTLSIAIDSTIIIVISYGYESQRRYRGLGCFGT
jgi:hypothetical protein